MRKILTTVGVFSILAALASSLDFGAALVAPPPTSTQARSSTKLSPAEVDRDLLHLCTEIQQKEGAINALSRTGNNPAAFSAIRKDSDQIALGALVARYDTEADRVGKTAGFRATRLPAHIPLTLYQGGRLTRCS